MTYHLHFLRLSLSLRAAAFELLLPFFFFFVVRGAAVAALDPPSAGRATFAFFRFGG